MNIGARQGLINRAMAGKRGSSTSGNNAGRPPKLRVACPVCPPPQGDYFVYAYVGAEAREASCKNNHTFSCDGKSKPAT